MSDGVDAIVGALARLSDMHQDYKDARDRAAFIAYRFCRGRLDYTPSLRQSLDTIEAHLAAEAAKPRDLDAKPPSSPSSAAGSRADKADE